jgi:PAS domain S-box-containing protein
MTHSSPFGARWRAYALALTVTGVTLAVRMELAGWFGDRPMLLLFILPIFLSAFVGGLGPGLVATAVAALGASYWLIPPLHSFAMASTVDTWDWLILILVGALISTLTEVRLKQAAPEALAKRSAQFRPERKVRVGFGFALSCLGVVGIISFTSVTHLSEEADRTRHSEEVISTLRLVLSTTTDVETAQRGYIITGNEGFLQPYAEARHRIDDELGELRTLTADNVEQQSRLSRLVVLVNERIDQAEKNVERRRSQGFDAAQAAIAGGQGKQLQDRVRAIVAETEATERSQLHEREQVTRRSAMVARTVISGGSALAIGFVVIALFLISGDFAGSRRAEAALKEANERLEARVLERTAVILRDLTERKRAEEASALLAALVESSTDAIVSKDLHSNVTSWNAGAEKMFGYAASEMIGRSITVLIPPENQAEEDEILARIRQGERVEHFETERLRKDGSLIQVSVTVSPIKDPNGQIFGASNMARDISERKKAEARAVWLSSFPERNPSPILELDLASGVVHYVNPAALRQFPSLETEGLRHPLVAGVQALPGQLAEQGTVHRELAVGDSCFSQLLTSVADSHRVRIYSTDITDRRNAERALRDREAELHATDRRLAEIVQGMTEACFALDAQWRFSFVNDRVEILLNRKREQMLGRTLWEVFPTLQGTAPGASYQRAMGERIPVAFEVYSPISARWLDVRLFPTADGMAVFLLDIQARKMAELERENFVSLVENSTEFIGMRNLQGVPIFINQAALELVGLDSMEQAVRTTTADFLFEEDRAFIRDEFVPRVLRDGHAETELRFRHFKTGEAIWMIYNAFVVRDSHGQPRATATVSRDITDRKRAEQEIRELNADLERRVVERTDQLEAANKELEAFSYSVSHDLRAPLRAVSGFSQIVLEDYGGQLPLEGKQHLQTICDGAQRMGMLIDDLLSFARLSRLPLMKQTVDAERQVRDSLDELQSEQNGRALDVRVGELPACYGDPALLKQVWLNLLSNALKYTKNREPAVVEIGSTRETDTTVYFVRDNGTGFDMQYAGKLFGVFQRLHRQEDFAGTGVGLAIVQRIVNRHGGRIWADAAPHRGATFYFTLPGEAS